MTQKRRDKKISFFVNEYVVIYDGKKSNYEVIPEQRDGF